VGIALSGIETSDFHTKCDGHWNTQTLLETTKGFIFGGFTPIPWDSVGGTRADGSRKSFQFSLTNPGGSAERKFGLSDSSSTIVTSSSYGPVFGRNNDISVCDSYTNLGGSFVNDTGIEGKQVLTGEYRFQVKEIEVFAANL
jgi:hypothetical protein